MTEPVSADVAGIASGGVTRRVSVELEDAFVDGLARFMEEFHGVTRGDFVEKAGSVARAGAERAYAEWRASG